MIGVGIAVALVALGFVIVLRARLARQRRFIPGTLVTRESYAEVKRPSRRTAADAGRQRALYAALAGELAKVDHERPDEPPSGFVDLSGDS